MSSRTSDFNYQLRHWLATVVDQRTRHGQTPLQRFVEEKPHLLPLPAHPYDTARVVYRVCGIDGYVEWQGNRYAVPYDHVTDLLPVRITPHELFIYAADLQCIARHELAPRGQALKLDPLGFHKATRRPAIDLDQLRQPRDLSEYDRLPVHCGRDVSSASSAPNQENDPWPHAANPKSNESPLTTADEGTRPAPQTPVSPDSSRTSSSSDSDPEEPLGRIIGLG